jgi:hypothetical protein
VTSKAAKKKKKKKTTKKKKTIRGQVRSVLPDPMSDPELGPMLVSLGATPAGEGFCRYQPPERGARPVFTLILKYSPRVAEQILRSRNAKNRNRNLNRCFQMVLDADDGRYPMTGDTIVFTHEVQLNDGSHRLYMVVLRGKAHVWPTVIGVAPEAFQYTDRGGTRSLTNAMEVQNKTDSALRAQIAHQLFQLDNDMLFERRNNAATPTDGIVLLSSYGLIVQDAIEFVKGYKAKVNGASRWKTPLSIPQLAAAYAHFSVSNPDVARYYIASVITENCHGQLDSYPIPRVIDALHRIYKDKFNTSKTKSLKVSIQKILKRSGKKVSKDNRYPLEHAALAALYNGWNVLCSGRNSNSALTSRNFVTNGQWDDGEPRYTMPETSNPTQKVIRDAFSWENIVFTTVKDKPITNGQDFMLRMHKYRSKAVRALEKSQAREQQLVQLDTNRERLEALRRKEAETRVRMAKRLKTVKSGLKNVSTPTMVPPPITPDTVMPGNRELASARRRGAKV